MFKTNIVKMIAAICLLLGSASLCWAEDVYLSWNAPQSGGAVQGYYLYYGTDSDIGTMTKVGPLNNDVTSYRLALASAGSTKYYFYVRAFNDAGEGPASTVKVVNIHLTVSAQ